MKHLKRFILSSFHSSSVVAASLQAQHTAGCEFVLSCSGMGGGEKWERRWGGGMGEGRKLEGRMHTVWGSDGCILFVLDSRRTARQTTQTAYRRQGQLTATNQVGPPRNSRSLLGRRVCGCRRGRRFGAEELMACVVPEAMMTGCRN